MKSIPQIITAILILLVFVFTGCKKCYLIKEGNESKNELSLGEFYGEEIEGQENQNFIANSGTTYIECR